MQEVVCLFFQSAANCFSEPPALVPINFFANIQILGLKIPGSLDLHSTKHLRWKQIQPLISYTRNSHTVLGLYLKNPP